MPNRRQKITRVLAEQARWLCGWLNSGRDRNGDQGRVRNLIARLQELEAARQAGIKQGKRVWQMERVKEIEGELVELTRFYKTWPRYGVESDGSGIGIAHMWERGSLEESQATVAINKLVEEKALNRLGMCVTCKTHWVFRLRSNTKHCSEKCRQARYEATPKRKAQKCKLSHDHYWNPVYGKFSRVNRKKLRKARRA